MKLSETHVFKMCLKDDAVVNHILKLENKRTDIQDDQTPSQEDKKLGFKLFVKIWSGLKKFISHV